MLKGNKKYIIILIVCFTALIVLQLLAPKPINWKPSYSKKDKIPFGTSALYDQLPAVFPLKKIESATFPLYTVLKKKDIQKHNYIIINDVFKPDTLDTRELFKFVSAGNSVFISANYFEGKFSDSLKLKTNNPFNLESIKSDSLAFSKIYKSQDTVKTNFTSPDLKNSSYYSYSKGFEGACFSSFDTAKSVVLGVYEKKGINFIKIKMGKGEIFINSIPEAFSNYHFVNTNYSYVYKALSYLPNQSVIWDEYYKTGNDKSDSPLRVIFSNPLLLKAYYVLILSLILFMVFGAKRKQRIIPVIEPCRNTTLDFVGVVGTLYYQTGNHKNIVEKKINYFLEFIRANFQTKTTIYDDTFISRIAILSGIDEQSIHSLFYYFSDLSSKQNITQTELLKLNSMIENFHKQNKR